MALADEGWHWGGPSDAFPSPAPPHPPLFSQLNRDLYEVMSKLDKQHSSKVFIIKGVPR